MILKKLIYFCIIMPKKYHDQFITTTTHLDKDQGADWTTEAINSELENFEHIFELMFISKHFSVLFKLSQPEV